MGFSNILRGIKPYLSKVERYVTHRLGYMYHFLQVHYTWLGFVVLILVGGGLIFFTSWLSRYSFFDWWRWKSRAVRRLIIYVITLCVAKLILT
ncbi:MAG: hypothetical protein HUK25_04240 [Treponema sp.]|nr:hypothetical protein [Treponema sp.]